MEESSVINNYLDNVKSPSSVLEEAFGHRRATDFDILVPFLTRSQGSLSPLFQSSTVSAHFQTDLNSR